jgi:hypothetical protein
VDSLTPGPQQTESPHDLFQKFVKTPKSNTSQSGIFTLSETAMGVQVNAQKNSDSEYVRAVQGWVYVMVDTNKHNPKPQIIRINNMRMYVFRYVTPCRLVLDCLYPNMKALVHDLSKLLTQRHGVVIRADWNTQLHCCQNSKYYEWRQVLRTGWVMQNATNYQNFLN